MGFIRRILVEVFGWTGIGRFDEVDQPIASTVTVNGERQMLLPGIADPHGWEGLPPERPAGDEGAREVSSER